MPMLRPLMFVALLFCSFQARAETVYDLASWSLRFDQVQTIRSALTGCYGTASYRYKLPSVAYVEAYRQSLLAKAESADLSGFVFTSTRDEKRDYYVVDLKSGRKQVVSQTGSTAEKGIVMCLCSSQWTHARDRDGQPNCSPSPLPPLGQTFLVDRDDVEAPTDTWTDSVTGWTWSFAGPALSWESALASCTGDFELPDIATLAHALSRINNSRLGVLLRDADAERVWSNEEFDWLQAMAVWIRDGDAGSVHKRTLYPALCVKR